MVYKIALVGNPNCGKTALFNAITGNKQRVANYPGVTVERSYGYFKASFDTIELIDLPGVYSLNTHIPDAKITHDVIMNNSPNDSIDAIICVLDATNLHNGLRLALQLRRINKPMIIALNMSDIAKRKGYVYDIEIFKSHIGCDVVQTVAVQKNGLKDLIVALNGLPTNIFDNHYVGSIDLKSQHKDAANIIADITIAVGTEFKLSRVIDNVLLHPIAGMLILLVVLFTLFQSVFTIAAIPQQFMQEQFDALRLMVIAVLPNTLIGSLISNGIIAGIGAILVFLPQITIISLFIILLEDSGYMARAAFLMDKLMSAVGLHGKAFIPLLSSFACAIPGIIATRTIGNRVDRIITIMISPLMTCSARLPVYTLLISAFVPPANIFGIFSLQGLVMFVLYAAGIIFALLLAFIFKRIVFKARYHISIFELPSYKLPRLRNVCFEVVKPIKSFLLRAGNVILLIMIIIWFLSTFPLHDHIPAAVDNSWIASISKFIQPLFAPIGFSWEIVAALIPGFVAREVMVSAIATIYALSSIDMSNQLAFVIREHWSLATAVSLLTWYIFAPQCASTLAVAKKETNTWIYPCLMFAYQICLAYSMSYVVYRVSCMLGIG